MKARRVVLSVLLGVFVFYLVFFNHTEAYEVGIAWNRFSGELTLQDTESGSYHLTAPWVMVARIDTRPTRVCITSTTKAFNCKLVKFESSAFREFVKTQGFYYYWWSNRVSFNFGYPEEYRGMKDILRGYAFGAESYPFITIIEGY